MVSIGGFNHKDMDSVSPSTLSHCETYNLSDNSWNEIAFLREGRAFAGAIPYNQKFIYLFGGCHDEQVLNTIEKYDALIDDWSLLQYKMPKHIAKFGIVLYDDYVLLVGGIFVNFEDTNEVNRFNLKNFKWDKVNPMRDGRAVSGNTWIYNGIIYTIGGNQFFSSERMDVKANKWSPLPSYISTFEKNELETWCGCLVQA
jgi:N-acetylneuraminic acid mutarotase